MKTINEFELNIIYCSFYLYQPINSRVYQKALISNRYSPEIEQDFD
jgi:hypothetical protein